MAVRCEMGCSPELVSLLLAFAHKVGKDVALESKKNGAGKTAQECWECPGVIAAMTRHRRLKVLGARVLAAAGSPDVVALSRAVDALLHLAGSVQLLQGEALACYAPGAEAAARRARLLEHRILLRVRGARTEAEGQKAARFLRLRRHACPECSSARASFACGKCMRVGYCSAACQAAAWPSHKGVCREALD
jgi:hypothetical protein